MPAKVPAVDAAATTGDTPRHGDDAAALIVMWMTSDLVPLPVV